MTACIVLPTYNEVKNIPLIIPAIFAQSIKIQNHELHVLVVDDNSPDGTADAVRELMKNFPNLHLITGPKKGLGEAYKKGIEHALNTLNPDLILEMDADMQHDPELIPLFITLTDYGFSLVIGSRFAPGGSTPDFSLWRRFLSLFGNWLIRFVGGLPRIHDCTSGYRCIKAELLRKCNLSFLSTRGYSFQSSLLCELLRNRARLVEIPIVFPDRIHGASKLSLQDQVEFLLNIPKIRFRNSKDYTMYCATGFIGLVFHMAVYCLLTRLMNIPLEIASLFSIESSIVFNFTLQNRMLNPKLPGIFPKRELGRFHLLSGMGGLANYLILLILVYFFGVWDILANLTGIAAGIVINYSVQSLWKWKMCEDEGKTDKT